MLNKRKRPYKVSEEQYRHIVQQTYEGIEKKLKAAKILLENDEYISAGLYTYAIEEFGKLLLLKDSNADNNNYEINYLQFTDHKVKFELAFNHLQTYNHGECIVLNQGGYDPKAFDRHGFMIGLLVNFEARLSIFYSDFIYSNDKCKIELIKIPDVDKDYLKSAIEGLEDATNDIFNEISCLFSSK